MRGYMRLVRMYIKTLSFVIVAFMLVASPVALQAKSSNPPPANPAKNSFNSGYDKHSNELYSIYQQKRLGAPDPKDSKARSASSRISSNPKIGHPHSPIKKITFHSSIPTKPISPTK